ncbi:hypothetical protein LOK74_12120 [Brevibacillus humidisoli]|uniref:hypothetical protein n=1 Tax=Brevibacillus humidisoli TaxID=2895522 RepID=UPI001E61E655|nr:hypothetical protein [Brevibacillus humidisoli]UFJ43162.1 hypothetical protein LOK74_12120 [Brevibacillus humidisoli]
MRDYLLYCTYCSVYTLLHSYNKESGAFLGEYSLLYNDYTRDSIVLNKFLLAHLGHALKMIPSKTEEYMGIICSTKRFLEDDIDKYVQESKERRLFEERDRLSERHIGRVQVYMIKHLLDCELEGLKRRKAATPAEGQVLLGNELGIKKALEIIEQVLTDKQLA